jgi:hypothetical protein
MSMGTLTKKPLSCVFNTFLGSFCHHAFPQAR